MSQLIFLLKKTSVHSSNNNMIDNLMVYISLINHIATLATNFIVLTVA
ncbi:hypothetical protein VRK_12520 [Vibrio sp. MEBiC08052]|nr:hypothetical protein VRK_12520 [Vibrio sp. MEBiC08052]